MCVVQREIRSRVKCAWWIILDFFSVILRHESAGLGQLEKSIRAFTFARKCMNTCMYMRHVCLRCATCENITSFPWRHVVSAKFRLPEGKGRSNNSLFSRRENLLSATLSLTHKRNTCYFIPLSRSRITKFSPLNLRPKSIIGNVQPRVVSTMWLPSRRAAAALSLAVRRSRLSI